MTEVTINEDVSLMKASHEDIPFIIRIEKDVSDTKIYSPALSTEEWELELKNANCFFVIYRNKIVGNATYQEKSPDEIYIAGLVVMREFQRKGIGRAVLSYFLEKFKNKKISIVTHPDNPALKLYTSLGFTVQTKIKDYYGDGEPRVSLLKDAVTN